MEKSMESFSKIKTELPNDPAIPLWVYIWKKQNTHFWKGTWAPKFRAAQQHMEATCVSNLMDKDDVVCIYM